METGTKLIVIVNFANLTGCCLLVHLISKKILVLSPLKMFVYFIAPPMLWYKVTVDLLSTVSCNLKKVSGFLGGLAVLFLLILLSGLMGLCVRRPDILWLPVACWFAFPVTAVIAFILRKL
jgi:hypothetical protein